MDITAMDSTQSNVNLSQSAHASGHSARSCCNACNRRAPRGGKMVGVDTDLGSRARSEIGQGGGALTATKQFKRFFLCCTLCSSWFLAFESRSENRLESRSENRLGFWR